MKLFAIKHKQSNTFQNLFFDEKAAKEYLVKYGDINSLEIVQTFTTDQLWVAIAYTEESYGTRFLGVLSDVDDVERIKKRTNYSVKIDEMQVDLLHPLLNSALAAFIVIKDKKMYSIRRLDFYEFAEYVHSSGAENIIYAVDEVQALEFAIKYNKDGAM